jgi:uncharacterized RDD family membrane protein YckC
MTMSSSNPYQAPRTELLDPEDPAEAELATRSQRFGAALLDLVVGLFFGIPVMMALGMWEYVKHGRPAPTSLTMLSSLLGFIFFVLAHGYFLKKNGQTIGKKLVGVRIADLDGEVPSFGRLIGLRYLPISLVTLIPALGQLLPLIDVLFIFRSDRRCVHDLIAGTKVVRAE